MDMIKTMYDESGNELDRGAVIAKLIRWFPPSENCCMHGKDRPCIDAMLEFMETLGYVKDVDAGVIVTPSRSHSFTHEQECMLLFLSCETPWLIAY